MLKGKKNIHESSASYPNLQNKSRGTYYNIGTKGDITEIPT